MYFTRIYEVNSDERSINDLRVEACKSSASWLARRGDHLWQLGSSLDDDELAGVGIVSQMVGEISEHAIDAYDRERWYAGACLTRQLVEAQYLLAYFASDSSQASRWLRASPNRLDKSFRPAQLRKVGGFSGSDYKVHCDWGGHPSPSGKMLLPNHQRPFDCELLWIDLAQHAFEAVSYVWEATKDMPPLSDWLEEIPDRIRAEVSELMGPPPDSLNDWLLADPLAQRVLRDEFDPEWLSAQLDSEH